MASFFQKTRRGFWADANSTKSHPRTTDASVRFSTCGFRPAPRRGLHCAIYMLTCLTNARLLLIAMHKRADRRDAHPQRRASLGFTMTNANKHGCLRCAGNDPYTIVASDVMQADDAGGPRVPHRARQTVMKQHARSMPRLQGRSSAWLAVSRAGCCSRGARACEAIRAARLVGFRLDCARWRARCQSEQSSPARTSHTTMRLPRCTTVRAVPPLPPPPLPTPPAGRKKSLSLSLPLSLRAADSSQRRHPHTSRYMEFC